MGYTTKGTTPSPTRNFLSETIFFVALEVATYLASIMESTLIQNYFTLLQLIVAPPKFKTKPKVLMRILIKLEV